MPIHHHHIKNHHALAHSQHVETYHLDSCPSMAAKPSEQVVKDADHSIPAMEVFGLKVSGLDKRLISDLKLCLDIPLVTGKGRIEALNKDARVKIKPDTMAHVVVEFVRNDQGKLALKQFSLEFNHKLTLKNPASALNKAGGELSKFGVVVKDKVADARIKYIRINADGKVDVGGTIRALKVIKYRIKDQDHGGSVVQLNEDMLVKLGLLEPGMVNDKTRSLEHLSKKFDVQKLLRNIGAITKAAEFELCVLGDPSKISALKSNNFLQGPVAPINIRLRGKTTLGNDGQLVIAVDGQNSMVQSSFGTYQPSVTAKISGLTKKQPVDVDIKGSIAGVATDISVDTYSDQSVKSILPRRRQKNGYVPKPQSEDEFNASFASKSMRVDAAINVLAKFDGGFVGMDGNAGLTVKAENPYAKTQERGLTIIGDVSSHLELEGEYVSGLGLKNTQGEAQLSINPASSIYKKFPAVRPLMLDYKINVDGEGKARIKPPAFGAARLVSPLENFEGHFERIIDDAAFETYHPIGTRQNLQETLKLTGSQIKKAEQVTLLIDGKNSLPARLKLINEAKTSLCVQTLVFKHDRTGWQFAEALVAAAKRGVAVRVVVDGLGNVEALSDLYTPNPLYQFLRENNVELYAYNGQVETGLRKMFAVAQAHPEVFDYSQPKSIGTIAHMLRFLDEVVRVSEDDNSPVPAFERENLKQGVHEIFMGKKEVSPQNAVNELKQALQGNLTTLEEFFLAIKRMGKASFRWHEKYLIADNDKAIVGGMNIADEYLLGGTDALLTIRGKVQPAWRDTDVLITGEAVADVYASFRRNWLEVANEELSEPAPAKVVAPGEGNSGIPISMIQHRPFSDGDHKVTNFILYNLRSLKAGEKAWFETAYFLPRGVLRSLQKELVKAARRGVDVRILTNSEKTSDFGALVSAAVFDSRELLKAGARLYHRNDDRMVHAKVTVLGDKLTMVGSWNFDNRSASHDSEDVCAIYDEKTTQQMTAQLLEDMNNQSAEITLQDIGGRTLGQEIRSAVMLLAGELA